MRRRLIALDDSPASDVGIDLDSQANRVLSGCHAGKGRPSIQVNRRLLWIL
jgi:hypothetical protein